MFPEMTVDDLQTRSEFALDGFTVAYVDNLIRQARERIQTRWGSLVLSRLDSGELTVEGFKDVVARAALRVLRNPEGFTGETEGNYQYQKRATVAAGYLFFTDDDVIDLIGVGSKTLPGTLRVGIYGR